MFFNKLSKAMLFVYFRFPRLEEKHLVVEGFLGFYCSNMFNTFLKGQQFVPVQ